jgi:HK97 family phage major capsid protein
MARLDLTEANGWIAEEHTGPVIAVTQQVSAIENVARRIQMHTDAVSVPRLVGGSPSVIAEGATYPDATATFDDVTMVARKFGEIYWISEEDVQDSFVDVLNTYKLDFATSFAKMYDNAALGTTAASNGGTVPFESVYRAVSQYNSASNLIQTAGVVNLDDLSGALGIVETGNYWSDSDTVVIAHPSLKGSLRVMKDSSNNLVQQYVDPLGKTRENMFGYDVVWSYGARTSATATAAPAGNPLVIIGNRKHLLNGVRSGPESIVSRDAKFDTDGVLLKTRARRAFAVAKAESFAIVEVTAAP